MNTFILIALMIAIDGSQASGKSLNFLVLISLHIILRVYHYTIILSLQILIMLKRSAMMVILLTTKQLTSMFTVIIGTKSTTGNTVT